MEALDIEHLIEALLFVADGPVIMDDLARALDCEMAVMERAVTRLLDHLQQRGLRIVRLGPRVQMVTAPEASGYIERFLGISNMARLSAAALETLAVIAYRQPITRAQIEAIRGVNSDAVLRTLVARSLVAQIGRLEQAGRPILFGTTLDFLQYLGIQSLDELPNLPEFEAYAGDAQTKPSRISPEDG